MTKSNLDEFTFTSIFNFSLSIEKLNPSITILSKKDEKVFNVPRNDFRLAQTVLSTVANAWEIIVFDFSSEVSGTAPIDFSYTYDFHSFL